MPKLHFWVGDREITPDVTLRRDTFIYMEPRPPVEDFAQCRTCRDWLSDSERCRILRPMDQVPGGASCGAYVHGTPQAGGEPQSLTDPGAVGLVIRRVRCQNCISFEMGDNKRGHCRFFAEMNRKFAADCDPGVSMYGCCNAQRSA